MNSGIRTCRRTRARGFTLVELLMALSICALIGVCVLMMVNSVAQGTAGGQDGRRFLVRMQAIEAELNDILRPARCFLAAGQDANGQGYLVFWNDDASVYTVSGFPVTGGLSRIQPASKPNNAIQPSELAMLQLVNGELLYYRVAYRADLSAGARAAEDLTYPVGSDYYAAITGLKTLDGFSTRQAVPVVLARNVAAFQVTLDAAIPQRAKMATITITLRRQLQSSERPMDTPTVERTTALAISLIAPLPPST